MLTQPRQSARRTVPNEPEKQLLCPPYSYSSLIYLAWIDKTYGAG